MRFRLRKTLRLNDLKRRLIKKQITFFTYGYALYLFVFGLYGDLEENDNFYLLYLYKLKNQIKWQT